MREAATLIAQVRETCQVDGDLDPSKIGIALLALASVMAMAVIGFWAISLYLGVLVRAVRSGFLFGFQLFGLP